VEGDFDFVVVGAGSAGCVIASRLAESGEHRVLLLEAGGEDSSPWIKVPLGYARLLSDRRFNWMYRTEPEPGLNGRVLDQPCGRVIGGTGSMNGMLHVTGQPADYDRWRAAGNDGWGWADVKPWFDRVQVPAAEPAQHHPLADAFIAAAQNAGFPRRDGFPAERQEGAGYFRLNIRDGQRASSASSYPMEKVAVATEAFATRIVVENGEAKGVEYRRAGTLHRAGARREVILAAGTFNSPQLLQVSGLGGPAVGENLQNHFRASIVARCTRPITDNDSLRGWRRAAAGLRYALFRDGPLAVGTYAGGFFRSGAAAPTPDVQVVFWTYSVARRDAGGVVLHPFPGFTANALLLRPQSRGSVRARNADPTQPPEIRYNFLDAEADRRTLIAGMRLVRRIFAQPPLRGLIQEELAPGAGRESDEALLAYARETGGSVFHPVGTCAMGKVVDARLRVCGVRRLRIADASVMPAVTSGNTNAPTLMIAERAADFILGDVRLS
jgi:choline dehydrogenase